MALDFTALRNASLALNTRLFNLFYNRLFKGQDGVIDKMNGPYRITSVIEQIKTTSGESGTITRDYQADDAIWASDSPTAVDHLILQNVPSAQLQLSVGQQVSLKYTLILTQPIVGAIPSQLTVNGVSATIVWPNNTIPAPSSEGKTDIVVFRIIVKRTATATYSYTAFASIESYG